MPWSVQGGRIGLLGPLCGQKFINNSPKSAILACFDGFLLFLTSLGRYWADLAAIFGSESQMGTSEVVRGSDCGLYIFNFLNGPKTVTFWR